MPQYRIWDLHCHLLGVAGRTPEEKMANLLEIADRHGIERLCLFFSSTRSKTPTPEELKTDNDVVMQAMSHWANRTHGFCYVSGEHVDFSLAEMDRCIKHGPMVGIKLWVAIRLVLLNVFRSLPVLQCGDVAKADQVWFDIAMLESVAGVAKLVEQVGPQRIFFGSHAPLFYFESAELKLTESGLPETVLQQIRSANAQRVLP